MDLRRQWNQHTLVGNYTKRSSRRIKEGQGAAIERQEKRPHLFWSCWVHAYHDIVTAEKGLNFNGRILCYAHACVVYMECFAFVIVMPETF